MNAIPIMAARIRSTLQGQMDNIINTKMLN